MKKIYILIALFFASIYSFSQITDTQVINNANSYLNHNWNANSNNIWNNTNCGGKTVNTPDWVNVGNHTSLPYCWGGNSTLSAFDSNLSQGKSAGDDNTNVGYGAEPNCSVGVDCSGYVSRCYGLSTHYSTTMLNSNSLFGHYNNYNDLNVGDFVNKPGSHTRLVTQINNNGSITFLESGSGTGNVGSAGLWKVFQWTYTVSTLINDGYNPQYYTNMTSNNSGNPPNNDNCNDAITLQSNQNCNYTSGTVDDATDDGVSVPNCDNLSNAPKGVWYKFTPSTTTNTITFSPNSSMNPVLAIYSGNTCTNLSQIECDGAVSGGSGSNVVITHNSYNIGQTYWIRVYDYGNIDPTNGSFDICITSSNSGGSEDIFLTNVSVSPTTVNAGNDVTASATMNYSGSQLDTDLPSFNLDYYISTDCNLSSDDIYLDDDVSGLGSDDPTNDENQDLTIPANTPSGTYYILFVADADDELNENNENNNIECVQITVNGNSGGSEDIFLTNVSVSPTTVNAGNDVTASATMNYSGSQLDTNLPSFNLDYYISTDCNLSSDDIYLDDDVSGLGSDDPTNDENQDLTIPANTPSGTYYILFVADADDELNESNENNNIECVQIIVEVALSIVDYEFQNQLTIYPNPSSDLINISFNTSLEISKLYVYDLNGRLVKKEEGTNLNKINISELMNGIYLLKVVNNKNENAVFRIVKE